MSIENNSPPILTNCETDEELDLSSFFIFFVKALAIF